MQAQQNIVNSSLFKNRIFPDVINVRYPRPKLKTASTKSKLKIMKNESNVIDHILQRRQMFKT